MNPLALIDMIGIHGGLALDAAVPVQMAVTAPLGGNSDLVGAGGVGAGLRRPVAVAAFESAFGLTTRIRPHHRDTGHDVESRRLVVEASDAETSFASDALSPGI